MMTEYTFYQIECNGKRYVGHTNNFELRKRIHKSDCNNDKRDQYNYPVYQYIRANGGWNSCQISVIEICNLETKRDAEMREEYWRIEKEATLNSQRCYITKNQRIKNRTKTTKIWYNLNKDKYNKDRREKTKQKQLKKQMLIELLKTVELLLPQH